MYDLLNFILIIALMIGLFVACVIAAVITWITFVVRQKRSGGQFWSWWMIPVFFGCVVGQIVLVILANQ